MCAPVPAIPITLLQYKVYITHTVHRTYAGGWGSGIGDRCADPGSSQNSRSNCESKIYIQLCIDRILVYRLLFLCVDINI